jgi:hypothetical protein
MRRGPSSLNLRCLGFVLFAAAQGLPAQDVPRLQLKVRESLPVPGFARFIAVLGPTRCDGRGNIYYRPGVPSPAPANSGPVVRISADGRDATVFSLKSIPGFEDDTQIMVFSPGLRGEVHILAWKDDGSYVVHFDDDGHSRSVTKLDAGFSAFHLAVFPTGEFLATGAKTREKEEDPVDEPLTGVFDRNGRLIKELSFAGDVKPGRKEEASGPVGALSLGEAVPADDGNIYLMRATEKPLVFVISPAAEVIRKLTLDPPGEGFRGFRFSAAGGKIVMAFFKPKNDKQNSAALLFSLYDAETGERQIDYEPTADATGIFACYTPNQFTFLHTQNNQLNIVHAIPR